jgi:cellulose synthase operon protein C
MAKSLVEKYEQILNQDPGSMVFVELSKALIDRGEYVRAIDTCKKGIEHHPDSIVGRVLWGKALIHAGHPADAMEQFDKAVSIERDNPHAYNLIGEVLLHRGLYRSAIPILKRAVSLQPTDARVRQWLEQAQRALEGGPTPVLTDATSVDGPREFTPTVNQAMAETPAPGRNADFSGPRRSDETISGITDVFKALQQPLAAPPDAAAAGMRWEAPPAPLPDTPFPPATRQGSGGAPADPSTLETELDIPRPRSEPSHAPRTAPPRRQTDPNAPSVVVNLPGAQTVAPDPWDAQRRARAQQFDMPSVDLTTSPIPGVPARGAAAPGVPPPLPPKRSGILASIPEMPSIAPVTDPSTVVPKVDVTPETAAAMAQEYERELREKLLAPPPETFLRKHWILIAVGAVSVVAGVGGYVGYEYNKAKNKGRDVVNTLAEAQRALVLDTLKGYQHALDEAADVLEMSSGEERAIAIQAFANAILAAEYTAAPDARQKATSALAALKSDQSQRAALATRYYLADDASRAKLLPEIDRLVSGSPPQGWATAELLYIRARRLLAKGGKENETAALADLQRAFESERAHVRTLLAFAEYFQSKGDAEQAFKFYSTGGDVSPDNPRVAVGLAESRLALGRSLDKAYEDVRRVEGATAKEPLPATLRPRLDLVMGRLLSVRGDYQAAVIRLTDGASNYKDHAAEFLEALGDAQSMAGYTDKASDAFAKALDVRRSDPELRVKLARALVDAGRFNEAIRRTEPPGDDRKLHLVRGIARYQLHDYKRARSELEATRREGKVFADAAIYVALADLAEGDKSQARDVIVTAAKAMGPKPLARIALGRLDEADGHAEEAIKEYQTAASDAHDYEGPCSLGRLYLALGRLDDADAALTKAVQRNRQHAEALGAQAEVAFVRGDMTKARAIYEQIASSPQEKTLVAIGVAGLARVAAAEGRLPEARRMAEKAGRLDPTSVGTAMARAYVAYAVGDAPAAQRILEKASKAAPDEPAPLCTLGFAQWSARDSSAAEKTFAATESITPRPACAVVGSALVEGLKNPRGALKELELPADASPHDKALAMAARAILHSNRKEADKALALYPGEPLAHFAEAIADHADPEQARKELENAIVLDPSLAQAHFQLAEILARDDATQPRAVLEYEAFARMAPKAPAAPAAKKAAQSLRKRVGTR